MLTTVLTVRNFFSDTHTAMHTATDAPRSLGLKSTRLAALLKVALPHLAHLRTAEAMQLTCGDLDKA